MAFASLPRSLLLPSLFLAAASQLPLSVAAKEVVAAGSLEDRLAGALWGLFAGDALAMPVHWYYGGPEQIRRDFGGKLLKGFERAVHPFPQTIMQVSNTGGGGRGSHEGNVVGQVILHGKKEYWRPGSQYHYHHTLEAGENTLEASLARVVMGVVVRERGAFSADTFREDYVLFMTTPGSHNDTYASTCHRMFFAKWQEGVDPKDCPDTDHHNVDTIDGLVLPTVVALGELASQAEVTPSSVESAAAAAIRVLKVTRQSSELAQYIQVLTQLLAAVLSGTPLDAAVQELAQAAYGSDMAVMVRQRGDRDPMVACYVDGAFSALLHFAYKYANVSVSDALLASANAGGENVHRGAVLGALVGAAAGAQAIPRWLREGLFAHEQLKEEIETFLKAVRAPLSSASGSRSQGEL